MKMALLSQSSPSSCYAATTIKPHFLLPSHHHSLLPIPKSIRLPPIKSQESSSEPPIGKKLWSWQVVFGREAQDFFSKLPEAEFEEEPEESSSEPPIGKKLWSWQVVFGREAQDFFSKLPEAEFEEEPDFFSKLRERRKTKLKEEQSGGEEVVVSALWVVVGLNSIIIIRRLLLAASGFFPENWNKLFVKCTNLYPAFTPTVYLFVAGAFVYGLLKYMQNKKPQSPK